MNKRLENHFQFIDVGRGDPDKKSLRSRKTEYVEIYHPYTGTGGRSIPSLPGVRQSLLRVEVPGAQFHSQLVETGRRGQSV